MEWRSPALRTPCSQQGRLGEVTHPVGGTRGDGGAGGAGIVIYGGSSSVLKNISLESEIRGEEEQEPGLFTSA